MEALEVAERGVFAEDDGDEGLELGFESFDGHGGEV